MSRNTAGKLSIAFVVDDGLDKPDGVQQYILTLGKWLEEKGHSVNYLAGETKRTDIKNAITLSKNLKVRFNANSLSTPFPARPSTIKQLMRENAFDILHVQMPYSPLMAAQTVHYAPKQTKIIGTFHILPVGRLQYFGNKLLGWSLKFNLKKFDRILSVSAPAQDFAKKTFGVDSEVLANPVEIKKFTRTYKKRGKKINIVFLGRLVPRKGCLALLEAVNELVENQPDLDLVLHICGEGNQRQRLQEYVNSTKLKDFTRFHGFVSETEKVDMLNMADFAVFPSLSGESFGIVLIEAMAANAGLVLAGANPGYTSVFSGLEECLFNPRNPNELSMLMQRYIMDKDGFESMHERQQDHVKKFDVNVIGSRLLEIYKEPRALHL